MHAQLQAAARKQGELVSHSVQSCLLGVLCGGLALCCRFGVNASVAALSAVLLIGSAALAGAAGPHSARRPGPLGAAARAGHSATQPGLWSVPVVHFRV